MRRIFSILSMLVLLTNCNKEVVKENRMMSSTTNNSVTHNRSTSAMPVDYMEFNPCTQEYVHITGFWDYTVTWVYVNNRLNYTYHFQYDGVTGIGLTSGIKYQANGHVTEHDQSVWNGEFYQLEKSNSTNKIIFTSKGGGNNFSFYAFHHFKAEDDGTVTVDSSRYEFGYCQ
jgi:hypothetical protein